MNVDIAIIGGFLTRDPELRFTTKGKAVVQMTIAINRKWKTESGELKEEATFVDCEAWGHTAEIISKHFRRGSAIFVQGRHKLEQWEDKKSGEKRSRMKIVVESFQFIDRKQDSADGETTNERLSKRPLADSTQPQTQSPDEDDIPF